MKKNLLLLALIGSTLLMNAQQWVNLNLNHYWNESAFNYGDIYADANGAAVEITRVQYYLSGISFTHDGGQETTLTDEYVLASANIANYSLDLAPITSLEKVSFNLGVDADHNHLDPNSYDQNHPLAPQNPNMHWGWTAGYKFLAIEGLVDSDGDQSPDKIFQFHVTGDDNYLTSITDLETSGSSNGTVLEVTVKVNIANWLTNIDLIAAGVLHGVFPDNGTIMSNSVSQSVFAPVSLNAIEDNYMRSSNVFFDYSLSYAPTIFYNFPENSSVDLRVVDMFGKTIFIEQNLNNEGNYFINRELAVGTYIANLKASNGETITKRFIVR